jgi:hypothetical protein
MKQNLLLAIRQAVRTNRRKNEAVYYMGAYWIVGIEVERYRGRSRTADTAKL